MSRICQYFSSVEGMRRMRDRLVLTEDVRLEAIIFDRVFVLVALGVLVDLVALAVLIKVFPPTNLSAISNNRGI